MGTSALGIDLGTSTTLAALTDGQELSLLADARGVAIFPSVVAFPPNGDCLVGIEAKYRRPIDAANTIFSSKRVIGQPWSARAVQQFRALYPIPLVERDGVPHFQTRSGEFTATDIAAQLTRRVAAMLSGHRRAADCVAVGVPAEFGAPQREATLAALAAAGFGQATCVEEPHAVMRAYLSGLPPAARRILVYDLGGGTFNVTLGELDGTGWRVVATGGDDFLGGDDIDQLCAGWVNQKALEMCGWDFRTNVQSHSRLLAACEQAKITLSQFKTARLKLGAIEPNDVLRGREVVLERATLEQLVVDLVRRTFVVCDELIARAGLTAGDIDVAVLAGGSSHIPCVQATVAHYFGKPPMIHAQPDQLVAIGAALLAHDARNTRSRPAAGRASAPSAPPPAAPTLSNRPLRVNVDIGPLGKIEDVSATEVTKEGMVLHLPLLLPLQTALLVTVISAKGPGLSLPARVLHCPTPQEIRQGISAGIRIEFLALADATRRELEQLLPPPVAPGAKRKVPRSPR